MFQKRKKIIALEEHINSLERRLSISIDKIVAEEKKVQLDFICGHWLSQVREPKATIYKTSDGGYMLVMTHRNKVMKRLPVRVIDDRLYFIDPKGRDVEIEHSLPFPIIMLGSYGQYHRDDFTHENLNP